MNAIRQFAASALFDRIVIGLILLTAAIIGYEAFPSLMSPGIASAFGVVHNVILGLFIVEAIIKLIALSPKPWNYFKDGWNVFDFSLIVLSLLPISSEFAMLSRIFRLLRVLRLVNAFPELLIPYVAMILLLVFFNDWVTFLPDLIYGPSR